MFRKACAAVALVAAATAGVAPVEAHYHGYDRGGYYGHGGGYHGRGYEGRGYYGGRGYGGGYYRCRNDGTGGAIIGAIGGGLLGNAVSGYGDHTLGTVLGAGGGALIGNAIARSGSHRC